MLAKLIKKNLVISGYLLYQQVNAPRVSGIVSAYERYPHSAALRFCKELGLIREYIRGDKDVIHDIARGWDTYEMLYPEEKKPRRRPMRKR